MPRVTGPLFSCAVIGTFAGAVIHTGRANSDGSRAETTRASPALKFRRRRTAPPPTPAQTTARDRLTAATAYAKAPPAPDIPAIEALALARRLPFFQAASAYYFAQPEAPAGVPWDSGASVWDAGATTWPE
jgi:hypothetical protein